MNIKFKWFSFVAVLVSLVGCSVFNGANRGSATISQEEHSVPIGKVDFTDFVKRDILPLMHWKGATAWELSALQESMSSEQRKSIVKVHEEKGNSDGFETLIIDIQLKDAVAFGYPIKSLHWIIGPEFGASKVKFADFYSLSQLSQKFSNSDFKSHDGTPLCMVIDDREELKHTLYDKNNRPLPRSSEMWEKGCGMIGIINFDPKELTISSESGV